MFSFRIVILFYVNYVLCKSYEKDWWKDTVIYEIYPRSFMDSNGDGVGDINGITSKLDYLQDLGIECLYIPYIYETSDHDSDSYEITNHTNIDPLIGTLHDFDKLLEEIKERGMKIILDFVPNHTSSEHEWFEEAHKKYSPYFDYYVWKYPKGFEDDGSPKGPNNWQSLNGYYGWQYDWTMNQFYYHLYSGKQPDLNLRNNEVVSKIMNILSFWLDKGIDGVVIKNVDYLFEDEFYRDNVYTGSDISINYAKGNEESYKLVRKIRDMLEYYDKHDGRKRIVIADTENLQSSFYNGIYINGELKLSGRVLSQDIRNAGDSSAVKLADHLTTFMKNGQSPLVPTVWSTELHNERRIPSMYGDESVDIVNALTLLLPGVGFTYYGQELGVKGVHDNNWDKYSLHLGILKNDPDATYTERVPMPWNNTIHAGFTTAEKPWYPLSPDYWKFNVETEKSKSNSHLNFYKGLMKLRNSPKVKGSHAHVWDESDDIIGFSRCNGRGYLFYVLINLSHKTVVKDFVDHYPLSNTDKSLRIKLSSTNALQKPGDVIEPKSDSKYSIILRPRSLVAFGMEENST